MALGSTQPLNRNEYQVYFLGVKAAGALPPSCAVVMKSWNLNFLEPSGPLQACNRTAVPISSQDSDGNVHCLRVKRSHILSYYKERDWNARCVRGMNCYQNPVTGRKVLRSLSKAPIFTDHYSRTYVCRARIPLYTGDRSRQLRCTRKRTLFYL